MKHRNLVVVALSSVGLLACSIHGSVGAHHERVPPPEPFEPVDIEAPGIAPVTPAPVIADGRAEAEVTCYNEDLKIVGRRISGPGVGVLLGGNCDIILKDCIIDAGTWGIVSRGSGDIKLVDSFVRGGHGAVSQNGSGDIAASNTRFVGMLDKSGSGDFADGGGNRWE